MREILRSNNPVLLSFVEVLLRDAGVQPLVADGNMSIMEGSIGVLPRRILVSTDDLTRARKVLQEAGLGHWVNDDDPN
ncbi:MAG TPA: DUF2007 domain-containing protein [Hyphomicrobiaceae bacterium]|jgi:hypothetical protein